jgi:hypothetical protein
MRRFTTAEILATVAIGTGWPLAAVLVSLLFQGAAG